MIEFTLSHGATAVVAIIFSILGAALGLGIYATGYTAGIRKRDAIADEERQQLEATIENIRADNERLHDAAKAGPNHASEDHPRSRPESLDELARMVAIGQRS